MGRNGDAPQGGSKTSAKPSANMHRRWSCLLVAHGLDNPQLCQGCVTMYRLNDVQLSPRYVNDLKFGRTSNTMTSFSTWSDSWARLNCPHQDHLGAQEWRFSAKSGCKQTRSDELSSSKIPRITVSNTYPVLQRKWWLSSNYVRVLPRTEPGLRNKLIPIRSG